MTESRITRNDLDWWLEFAATRGRSTGLPPGFGPV